MKQVPDQNKDEIDLVDIFVVLLKRKWIIIWLLIIAFVSSGLYIVFSEQEYEVNIVIQPPQEYNVGENNLLKPSTPRMDTFSKSIEKDLFEKSYQANNSEREYFYSFTVNTSQDPIYKEIIKIHIKGQKDKIIEVVSSLYTFYTTFEKEIKDRNETFFLIANNALQNNLTQKTKLLDKLTEFLTTDNILILPQGSENAILNTMNYLISDITELKKTGEFNKTVQLTKGDFKLVKSSTGTQQETYMNQDIIDNVEDYITPAKSRKRQLLPVIVSAFLAFFVGIFLAFVIEFFSREDVKRRLKEINR